MTDILDLPGWRVTEKRLAADEYELEVSYDQQPDACQKCGVIGRLYKHGQKPVTYRDSPIRGRPVRLLVNVQRFKCRDCGGTFQQPLDSMEPGRLMTVRCAEYIAEQCLRDTFTNIAAHLGVNETTVRSVAADYIQKLDSHYTLPEVEYLGIDELYIGGEMRAMITDVGGRKPVDMMPGRDKQSIIRWLRNYPFRKGIKAVSTDMWAAYRDAVHEVLGVSVVIDKFHVVKMANTGLENTRRRLRPNQEKKVAKHFFQSRHNLLRRPHDLTEKQRFARDMTLDNVPEIREAYELKEALFRIYDLPKAEAVEAYDAWLASVPKAYQKDFGDLMRAMKNWRAQILNYFDFPITNAYTEALNGIAKVTNRMGRGYSFEVLRARILFKGFKFPSRPAQAVVSEQVPKMVYRTAKVRMPRYLIGARLRARLLIEQDCTCFSCHGKFAPAELFVSEVAPVVRGEHKANNVLLCQACHTRFHIEAGLILHTDSTS